MLAGEEAADDGRFRCFTCDRCRPAFPECGVSPGPCIQRGVLPVLGSPPIHLLGHYPSGEILSPTCRPTPMPSLLVPGSLLVPRRAVSGRPPWHRPGRVSGRSPWRRPGSRAPAAALEWARPPWNGRSPRGSMRGVTSAAKTRLRAHAGEWKCPRAAHLQQQQAKPHGTTGGQGKREYAGVSLQISCLWTRFNTEREVQVDEHDCMVFDTRTS